MKRSYVLILILFSSGLSHLCAQVSGKECFLNFFGEGQRLVEVNEYQKAIDQFIAARRCAELTPQQREQIDEAIDEAQIGYITSINEARQKAEEAQRLAEDRAKALGLQVLITEANRIAFLADQELENGNSKDGLALAYYAYSKIDTMPIPKVKLSFGDAIYQTYRNTFAVEQGRQIDAQLSSDGKYMLIRRDRPGINLWHLQPRQSVVITPSNQALYASTITPNAEYILTGDAAGQIQIWNMNGDSIKTLEGHFGEISGFSFSPDGTMWASWSRNGSVFLWDINWRQIAPLELHDTPIVQVKFSPDNQTLITHGSDQSVGVWSISGEQLTQVKHEGPIYDIQYAPDGSSLITCAGDGNATLYQIQADVSNTLSHPNQLVTTASFLPNQQKILTTSGDGKLHFWNMDGSKINSIQAHQDLITQTIINPNGKDFLTVSRDRTMKRWDPNGNLFAVLIQHTDQILHAEFASDGQHILSTSKDGTIKISDMRSDVVMNLEDEDAAYLYGHFSPDGQQVVGILKNGNVILIPMPNMVYESIQNGTEPRPELDEEKKVRYDISN